MMEHIDGPMPITVLFKPHIGAAGDIFLVKIVQTDETIYLTKEQAKSLAATLSTRYGDGEEEGKK